MARPYAVEMSKLAETLSWAMSYDITALRQAVKTAGLSSLMAIGSGGSLTAAHALASLHRRRTGHLAAVATPLVAIAEPVSSAVSNWLLSAGGSNIDILAAFRALVLREPRQLGILCGNAESPLAAAARAHPFTDLVVCPPPTGKDGFLATNSLLAFATLLARSYVAEFGRSIPTFDDELNALLGFLNDAERWDRWRTLLQPAWARRTTLVLYGPTTHIGAVDLESKFTEAALGNLQVADYRNFAHGTITGLPRELKRVPSSLSSPRRTRVLRTKLLLCYLLQLPKCGCLWPVRRRQPCWPPWSLRSRSQGGLARRATSIPAVQASPISAASSITWRCPKRPHEIRRCRLAKRTWQR